MIHGSLKSSLQRFYLPDYDVLLEEILHVGNQASRHLIDKWILCIATTIAHIHSAGVIHLDLSPKSFIVKRDCVYLMNFESSRQFDKHELYMQPEDEVEKDDDMWMQPGVRDYVPAHVTKSDIFPLGILFLKMVGCLLDDAPKDLIYGLSHSENPRGGSQDLSDVEAWYSTGVAKRLRPGFDVYHDCIKAMIHRDRAKRPTAEQVVSLLASKWYTRTMDSCPCFPNSIMDDWVHVDCEIE